MVPVIMPEPPGMSLFEQSEYERLRNACAALMDRRDAELPVQLMIREFHDSAPNSDYIRAEIMERVANACACFADSHACVLRENELLRQRMLDIFSRYSHPPVMLVPRDQLPKPAPVSKWKRLRDAIVGLWREE